jgi:hypothetical protein
MPHSPFKIHKKKHAHDNGWGGALKEKPAALLNQDHKKAQHTKKKHKHSYIPQEIKPVLVEEAKFTNLINNDNQNNQGNTSNAHHHHHHAHALLKQESSISRFLAGSHSDGDEEDVEQNLFLRIISQIKSVDGIDEAATVLGQILPGLAGPVAASIVMCGACIAVPLGFFGMKEEYKDAVKEYHRILAKQVDTKSKLSELCAHNNKLRQLIAKKFGIDIPENNEAVEHKDLPLDQLGYYLVEAETLKTKKVISALDKKWGWLGAAGMAGMSAGMVPGAISSIMSAAMADNSSIVTPTLVATASGLKIASGAIFAPAQVAMGAYGIHRMRQGIIAKKQIKKNRDTFKTYASKQGLSEQKNVEEIAAASISSLNKTSIYYGGITAAGQAVMLTSNMMGIFGVTLPIAAPFMAVGAAATIIPAVMRIVAQNQENHFKGILTPRAKETLAQYDLQTLLFKTSYPDISTCKETILQKLNDGLAASTDRLAVMKELSLLHHLMNDRLQKNKSSKNKLHTIDGWLQGTKIFGKRTSNIKNSGLEKTIKIKTGNIHSKNREDVSDLLGLKRNEANRRIINCAIACLDNNPDLSIIGQEAPAQFDTEKLLKLLTELGLEKQPLYKKIEQGRKLNKDETAQLARKILNKGKGTFKSIRFNLSDSMIATTRIMKICEDLQQESQELSTAGPVASTLPATPHNADTLAKSLLYENKIPEGYSQFIAISRKVDPQGNTITVYKSPFSDDIEARITYTETPAGKLIVSHGSKSNALIPVEKKTDDTNTGIEIHSINEGKYTGIIASHGSGISNLDKIGLNENKWQNLVMMPPPANIGQAQSGLLI